MSFGILAGALLAGAGNAATEVGKQWREDDIRAENRRMELEKEKRVEDAQVRAETRQQNYQIASENRSIENKKLAMQNELEFNTNPKNVQSKIDAQNKVIQAELDLKSDPSNIKKQTALKEAELALETEAQIKVHKATDTTDYAGRKITHELANLEIQAKEAELKGMPKQAIDAAKGYIEQAKQLAVTAAGYEINSPQRSEINTQINNLYKNANSIYTRFGYGPSEENQKQAEDTNPLGIGIGKKEPTNYVEKIGVLGTKGLPVKQPETVKQKPALSEKQTQKEDLAALKYLIRKKEEEKANKK